MMTPESVRDAMSEMDGWTYAEWKLFATCMEQQFSQKANRLQMNGEDNAAVMHHIAAWNEWPAKTEAPAQTRMGF